LKNYVLVYGLGHREDRARLINLHAGRLSALLEASGIILRSWVYEENALLLNITCDEQHLEKAVSTISRYLADEVGPAVQAFLPSQVIEAESMLPSEETLGFLVKAARDLLDSEQGGPKVALLLAYTAGYDIQRIYVTATYLGIDPADLNRALREAERLGWITPPENLSITRLGAKVLDGLIPSLRPRWRRTDESPRLLIDYDGREERLSYERLSGSLYNIGVDANLLPSIVSTVDECFKGRAEVAKRELVSLVLYLLSDLEPRKPLSEMFSKYVHALDNVFIAKDGALSRFSWSIVRGECRMVLEERGLKVHSRLVRMLSENVVEALRRRYVLSGERSPLVLRHDELVELIRTSVPAVSTCWLELRDTSPKALCQRSWADGLQMLKTVAALNDFGERKRLTYKMAEKISEALLLHMGMLPSRDPAINAGLLAAGLQMPDKPLDERQAALIRRTARVLVRIISQPLIPTPAENKVFLRLLAELERLASTTALN